MHLLSITTILVWYFIIDVRTQQCDQPSDVARFDCHPEDNASQQACEARKCCWRSSLQKTNSSGYSVQLDVPYCFYPSDYPAYEVISNETTDFGQRLHLYRSQTTYLPNDIRNLTVDLIFETQQRFRMKIYDSQNSRYEVPIPVPVVAKKADTTDYDVAVNSKPFWIRVTRKSTGAIL